MSANRYSSLNRRPGAASSLFESYPGNSSSRPGGPNGYGNYSSQSPRPASPYSNTAASSAAGANSYSYSNGHATSSPGLFSNSPYGSNQNNGPVDKKDKPIPVHHTTSLLDSLESQNETTQTTLLSQKVSQLKSLTIAIGDEIRDSSSLAGQINDQFEGAGVRLKGTMKRMLRMAEKTGVGWRVWVLFFLAVWALFAYVWLF